MIGRHQRDTPDGDRMSDTDAVRGHVAPGQLSRLWALPPFRWLFLGRFASFLGSGIAPIALAFAVLDLTDSAIALGLVLACRALPQAVLTIFGGVLADRWPRQRVLTLVSIAGALTQGAVAVLVLSGEAQLWQLCILEFFNGAVAALVLPAAAGLTPQTVSGSLLQPANALLRLGMNVGLIGGAAVGGVLVAVTSPGWGLTVDAAAFALAALAFSRIRLRDAAPEPGTFTFVHDLRVGWAEFVSRTWVWVVVISAGLANLAFAGGNGVLGPLVAEQDLGRAGWGLTVATASVGMLLGGLLGLRVRPRRPLLVGVLATAFTAPYLAALALAPVLPVLLPLALLAGMGLEVFGIGWDLSLQQNIPGDRLSRVAAYDALGSFVLIPIGQILAGPAAAAWGVDTALLLAAALMATATVVAVAVPSVRHLERRDLGPDGAGNAADPEAEAVVRP